jgi:iron-sulfur cluster assembly accessory protein
MILSLFNSSKSYILQRHFSIQKRLLKAPITISSNAASRLSELILKSTPPPLGVRIGVRKRGCNGLSFTMKYVTNDDIGLKMVAKDDVVNANGVKVFIDPSALFTIIGAVMDWKDDNMTSEFTFINPNSKGSCGCGESFNV